MDYEEKRYEVAKEILLKLIIPEDFYFSSNMDTLVSDSIHLADKFINELKMTK